jgi:hypothetical protein
MNALAAAMPHRLRRLLGVDCAALLWALYVWQTVPR